MLKALADGHVIAAIVRRRFNASTIWYGICRPVSLTFCSRLSFQLRSALFLNQSFPQMAGQDLLHRFLQASRRLKPRARRLAARLKELVK